jgi:hypothetical protein
MANRLTNRALLTATLGIVLSLMLAASTTASPASSNTAGALQLDPPAAPSNCRSTYSRGGPRPGDDYTIVSWTDNASNEDGFVFETWRNQSGGWVLFRSANLVADSTYVAFDGRIPSGYKFRVKAFNASGASAWSNWAH